MSSPKSVTRSGKTSTFIGNGDTNAIRAPLEQWTGIGSSDGKSADDFSNAANNSDRVKVINSREKASFDSAMSDVDECDERRRFRNVAVKVNYNSDSCLTPRSRRTLRRMVSTISEPWPSIETPSKPTLDTIFSPTHEILHPLQSLRLERSFSARPVSSNTIASRSTNKSSSFRLPMPPTKSIKFEGCKSAKPQANPDEFGRFVSFNPRSESAQFDPFTCSTTRSNFIKFQSYASYSPKRNYDIDTYKSSTPQLKFAEFEGYTLRRQQSKTAITVEEKLEQKQNLIDNPDYVLDDTPPETPNKTIYSDAETVSAHRPKVVAIVVNAEKKLTFAALNWAINDVVQPGDEIIILGVLKHIFSPMGFKMLANTDPLFGTNKEFLQASVTEATQFFEQKLAVSGRREECEKKKVKLTVRIAPGACARLVVVQELAALKATYAVFDRKTMRNRRYYCKHLSCHAVRMRQNGRSTRTVTPIAYKSSPEPKLLISSLISRSISPKSANCTCPESPRPTFWRKLTSFKLRRRGSRTITPQSSDITHTPSAISQSSQAQLHQARDNLSFKLRSFTLSIAACTSCVGDEAHSQSSRSNQGVISITIPTPICAS
ncbi:uncharacterized protein [Physcomitrium patens]|uniref:Uncharacterized protein n=1 Tax=Physcomitrium patens TaxID=3218 RepID=A0A2K1INI6_PHYPA|nr:uncharacterized protein LOC112274920 [Physcomitrium patens]PNR30834.1 hypothetical protein PHYPA_027150 [Physcomitrium patens]|eukprot:XP_024360544.1 uncharacterized protein LOC112274920 [Physcomitrella patens]